MFGCYDNIRIQGISATVPSTIERNEIYANVLGERRVKKQIKLTGVKQRHVSSSIQRASDLCYSAAVKMLEHLKWSTSDIKVLLFVTQGPDFSIPSTAFLIHKRLGLSEDCVCFDINLGCTAFNVGMQTISSMLQSGNEGDKAILLIGDTVSIKSPYYSYGPDEVAKLMLFGSAGACVAVEKVNDNKLYYENLSDGERYKAIYGEFNLPSEMDGSEVFSFAVNDVAETLRDFRDKCNICDENIDYYAFHQAQKLILDDICESCDISPNKELRSYCDYGNTSGASVLVSLCANSSRFERGSEKRFLLTSFGVGLSWGCLYTSIFTDNILPISICDEYYTFRPLGRGLHGITIGLYGGDRGLVEWIGRYFRDQDAYIKEEFDEVSVIVIIDSSKSSETTVNKTLENFCCGKDRNNLPMVIFGEACFDKTDKDESRIKLEKYFEIADKMKYRCSHGVIYDRAGMEIIPIEDGGQNWYERYLNNYCPESMTKASDVARLIEVLIQNAYTIDNHTVIEVK